MGSDVLFHREDTGEVCPCVTPEGFRDPAFHRLHAPNQFAPSEIDWAYDGEHTIVVVWTGLSFESNKTLTVDDYGLSVSDSVQNIQMGSLKLTNVPNDEVGTEHIAQLVDEFIPDIGTQTHDFPFTIGTPSGVNPDFLNGIGLENLGGQAYINPPVCNEQGILPVIVEFMVKASVQPAFSGLSRHAQRSNQLLGEVMRDDKLGIFPCVWGGRTIDFDDWSDAGEDFIRYDGQRYVVVSADKVPDIDGSPDHHWECGLRLVKDGRPTDA